MEPIASFGSPHVTDQHYCHFIYAVMCPERSTLFFI